MVSYGSKSTFSHATRIVGTYPVYPPNPEQLTSMKTMSLSKPRYQIPEGLFVGLILLIGVTAGAQNLLKNGDFQQPLGATNWTVGYLHGGPDDFEIKDRTGIASRFASATSTDLGGHLRPQTDKLAHAYFSQTVTNLEPGHSYTISGWMKWVGPSEFGNASTTYRVYFEAIGGGGVARTPNLDDTTQAGVFNLNQTPDAEGKIEVRLHLDKFGWCIYDKLPFCNAYFDDLSLTY